MIYLLSWGVVILVPIVGLMGAIISKSPLNFIVSVALTLPFFAVTRIWGYCPYCRELKQRRALVCPRCHRQVRTA
jgi:hypothetical protein